MQSVCVRVETHAPCYDNSPPEIPPRDDGANPSDEATKATNINSDEMKRFIVLYGIVTSSSRGIPLCCIATSQDLGGIPLVSLLGSMYRPQRITSLLTCGVIISISAFGWANR